MRLNGTLIALALFAGLLACMPKDGPQTGAALYARHCVACHGRDLTGTGPLAADLPVPPADLTRISARAGGVFPTGDVMATIFGYRGADYDRVMPGFGPDLQGPEVMWRAADGTILPTPQGLLDLAQYLQSTQRP